MKIRPRCLSHTNIVSTPWERGVCEIQTLLNKFTDSPHLMRMTGPEKIMLDKIALFEDFGTTLCQDTEKSRWIEESHYYSMRWEFSCS